MHELACHTYHHVILQLFRVTCDVRDHGRSADEPEEPSKGPDHGRIFFIEQRRDCNAQKEPCR